MTTYSVLLELAPFCFQNFNAVRLFVKLENTLQSAKAIEIMPQRRYRKRRTSEDEEEEEQGGQGEGEEKQDEEKDVM